MTDNTVVTSARVVVNFPMKCVIDGVEHVMIPKALYDEWIAADDAMLDWADANARWFDISTAPRDGKEVLTYPRYRVTSWSDELGGFWFWSDYDDDAVLYNPQPTHWAPLPPPPSNPPLPAPLERFGEVLRRVKGTT